MNLDYNQKIIEDFGLSNMSSENQEKMIERIGTLLFEAVIERSVDAMDDAALDDFENLLAEAGGNYQKVIDFLKQRVQNFNVIVSDEMGRLKRATSGIFA